MKQLPLVALSLFTLSTAQAASECHIKEVRKVEGYFLTYVNIKSEVPAKSLDECIESAKDLLGKEVTGTYTHKVHTGRGAHARTVVDEHAVFRTDKVILQYRGDETHGETIIAKFKKRSDRE